MKVPSAALLSGVVFGAGLALSGMGNANVILDFLRRTTRPFDPALVIVLVTAIAGSAIAFRVIPRRAKPVFTEAFQIPTRRDIDRPLVLGAIIFGAGWPLSGFCAGPALVAIGAGSSAAALHLVGVAVGMWLFGRFDRAKVTRPTA